jgi:hypothetical protein
VKTLSGTLCGLLFAGLATGVPAAELELEGNRLTVSGLLDGAALKDFQAQVASGKVRTVVFENSMGGSPEVAAEYARAIQANGLDTEARGECQGVCAFAFLAGKQHRFGRGLQVHALLIPSGGKPQPGELSNRWLGTGATKTLADFTAPAPNPPASDSGAPAVPRTAGGTLVASAPAAGSIASPATGGPIAAASGAASAAGQPAAPGTTSAARADWQPNQGVLFTSTPTLFGRINSSFYCDGSQGRDMSRCKALPDADPYKLGVLTR